MKEKAGEILHLLLMLIAIGSLVPMGQAMTAQVRQSIPYIIGRVLLNVAFTCSAGLLLVWQPDAPTIAVLGLAGLLSSLGMTGAEKFAMWYLQKWSKRK